MSEWSNFSFAVRLKDFNKLYRAPLFLQVMTANADGRPLYTDFQFLPSARRYPEYYEVIDAPIDLKTVAQKIQGGEYLTLGDLEKDLQLMVRNACHFNEPGSQIYKDAKMLKKVGLTPVFL